MSRIKKHGTDLFSSFYRHAQKWEGVSHRSGRRRSTSRVRRRRPDRWLARNVYDTRWSPLRLPMIFRSSRHILVCGGSCRILTMMQIYASAARLRSSGSPFFASAWKPRGSASDRYLGSFMAGRHLIAPIRQTLTISFSCLLDLVLLVFTLPTSIQSLLAPHLC